MDRFGFSFIYFCLEFPVTCKLLGLNEAYSVEARVPNQDEECAGLPAEEETVATLWRAVEVGAVWESYVCLPVGQGLEKRGSV